MTVIAPTSVKISAISSLISPSLLYREMRLRQK
jgi:hypothetical protein